MRKWLPWLVCGLLLVSGSAFAHKLKVFALVDGDRITGSVYFVGGAKATGARIAIADAGGNELAHLAPDAQGEFSYIPQHRIDHVIVADTGDGHVAHWTIAADTLPAGLATGTTATQAAMAPAAPVSKPAGQRDAPPLSDEALAALVEQSVARQLRPLREQLVAFEDRVRLQDVLGGIGYIAGLAGLALWWYGAGRRRP